jgi:hypothetical protein
MAGQAHRAPSAGRFDCICLGKFQQFRPLDRHGKTHSWPGRCHRLAKPTTMALDAREDELVVPAASQPGGGGAPPAGASGPSSVLPSMAKSSAWRWSLGRSYRAVHGGLNGLRNGNGKMVQARQRQTAA